MNRGVVSCFLCSPDRTDSDPVAPFGFRKSCVFLQETEESHHLTIINPLSLSSTNMWQIFSSESSASLSLMPKDETLMKTMWCKGYTGVTGSRALWGSDWQRGWLLLGNKTRPCKLYCRHWNSRVQAGKWRQHKCSSSVNHDIFIKLVNYFSR